MVKGGNVSYSQLVEELSKLSKRIGCSYTFVSGNPRLYVNPEISVPTIHAASFKKHLEEAGMLFDPAEAARLAIEEIKMNKLG